MAGGAHACRLLGHNEPVVAGHVLPSLATHPLASAETSAAPRKGSGSAARTRAENLAGTNALAAAGRCRAPLRLLLRLRKGRRPRRLRAEGQAQDRRGREGQAYGQAARRGARAPGCVVRVGVHDGSCGKGGFFCFLGGFDG